jgi:hypothetical protein
MAVYFDELVDPTYRKNITKREEGVDKKNIK